MRVRLLYKPKPDNYTESCMVNVTDGWRERNVCVFAPLRSVHNRHPQDVLHPLIPHYAGSNSVIFYVFVRN